MQRSQIVLTTLFVCLVVSISVCSQTLVKGDPPLTQPMVDHVVDFFEWSLGVHLSESDKVQVQQKLTNAWKANDRSDIAGTNQILELYMKLQGLSNDQLAQTRLELREQLVKLLREEKDDDVAKMLLALYDSSPVAAAHTTKPASTSI